MEGSHRRYAKTTIFHIWRIKSEITKSIWSNEPTESTFFHILPSGFHFFPFFTFSTFSTFFHIFTWKLWPRGFVTPSGLKVFRLNRGARHAASPPCIKWVFVFLVFLNSSSCFLLFWIRTQKAKKHEYPFEHCQERQARLRNAHKNQNELAKS